MQHEDEQLKSELSHSAVKIDSVDVPTPDFKFFKDMVVHQQAIAHRAQRLQLAIFIVVAALILSAVLFLMGRFETFFIALQGVAFFSAVAAIAAFFLRSRKLSQEAPR